MKDVADPDLRARFVAGMARAATTVSIVTTDGAAGRAGVTVSAMASVSADGDAPTLLVCVHHQSPAAAAILKNGVFCVNILGDDQSFISDAFAGRCTGDLADKFDCATWTTQETGAPRVIDPLVAFDCRVLSAERVGTHHVFIGAVADIFARGHGAPLVYANRGYGRAARIDPVAGSAGNGALRIGCFHTFGPHLLPGLLARMPEASDLTLIEGDHRRLGEALATGEIDMALLYDLDLDPALPREALGDLAPYVLLAADHPLAGQGALHLSDLAGEPMILLDAPPSGAYFTGLFTDAGLCPRIRHRSTSFEMVRGMVARGLGFSILATRPFGDHSYDGGRLVTRPLADPVSPSPVVLARRAGGPLSKAAESFAFLCRELFEQEL